MATTPDINWAGLSGKTYGYWIHPIGTIFVAHAGNYIYARSPEPHRWQPVYVGETDNLKRRLSAHEREIEAIRLGATHVHAHTNYLGEAARLKEEADLIQYWNPPLNTEHSILNRLFS